MSKLAGLVRLQVCAVLGVALCLSLGGCPGLESIFGPIGGGLTVSAEYSGEPTVDKTVDLVATISGGTEPYTIEWTLVSGPWVDITNSDQATASVEPMAGGIYKFAVAVSDSSRSTRTGTAEIEIPIADIQFPLPTGGATGASVPINGNPATALVSTSRSGLVRLWPRVSVFDPQYVDDQKTDMTVTYDIVSIPDDARDADVALDRQFDTISNQGTGDFDAETTGFIPTLDGVVEVTLRPNPDITYKTITNLATLVDNYGGFAPGDYTFRATVTNPDGMQRTRDLVVNLSVQDVTGGFAGGTADSGPATSAGPSVVRVKTLPEAGDNYVTDVVMTPDQTAALTVSVFPSGDTTYRFFLRDNVAATGLSTTDFVTPWETTV